VLEHRVAGLFGVEAITVLGMGCEWPGAQYKVLKPVLCPRELTICRVTSAVTAGALISATWPHGRVLGREFRQSYDVENSRRAT